MKRWKTVVAACVVALTSMPLGMLSASGATTTLGTFNIDPGNLYNAGHPAPVIGGPTLLQLTLPAGSAGQAITLSNVSGGVTQGVNAPGGPDGGYDPDLAMNIDPLDGISGIKADPGLGGFLGGVFTSDAEPADPAPAALDYTSASGTLTPNDASYAPGLDQVFFMGDGLTGTSAGKTQQFVVPAGATTLWLGVVDAGYYQGPPISTEDNTGGFNATVGIQPFVPANPQGAGLTVTAPATPLDTTASGVPTTRFTAHVTGGCPTGTTQSLALRSDATSGYYTSPYFITVSELYSDSSQAGQTDIDFKAGVLGADHLDLLCDATVVASAPLTVRGSSYVALGDSYSSGEGGAQSSFDPETRINVTRGGYSSGCHRSSTGYANEIASYEHLAPGAWTFAACSGAETRQFYSVNYEYAPDELEVPQLLSISPTATKLVTLTDGGNDVGFAAIMKACVYGNNAPGAADCKDNAQLKQQVYGSLNDLVGQGVTVNAEDAKENPVPGSTLFNGRRTLAQLYVDIADRVAPGGEVVVGGYPRFFGTAKKYYEQIGKRLAPSGYWCQVGTVAGYANLDVDYNDAQWIDGLADLGNYEIAASVTAANKTLAAARSTVKVVFAGATDPAFSSGVDQAFSGHRICDKGSKWLNGAQIDTLGMQPRQTSFHPNVPGQHAYATSFERVIPRIG
jgi:hypothetical protein